MKLKALVSPTQILACWQATSPELPRPSVCAIDDSRDVAVRKHVLVVHRFKMRFVICYSDTREGNITYIAMDCKLLYRTVQLFSGM
jgi:hypothetical protein